MKTDNKICCPICENDSNLSLQIFGEATLKASVMDGKMIPSFEILCNSPTVAYQVVEDLTQEELFPEELEPILEKVSQTILRYSDLENKTSITLHQEDSTARIFCPRCSKVFKLDRTPIFFGDNDE